MEGLSIDVGRIISKEISLAVAKPTDKLFFPTLITELCAKVRVDLEGSDKVMKDKCEIDAALIAILKSTEQPKKGGNILFAVNELMTTQSNLAEKMEEIVGAIHAMERKQQAYMAYVKQRDVTLRKALLRNFTHPFLAFPPFPNDFAVVDGEDDVGESKAAGTSESDKGSWFPYLPVSFLFYSFKIYDVVPI